MLTINGQTNLDDEYLEELAYKLKGTTVDDLRGKDWVYVDENGDAEFFQYSDEAVAHQYGGADRLDEELNIRSQKNLKTNLITILQTFCIVMEQIDLSLWMQETQSILSIFPEGGTDYTESLFQYTDPTGRIKIDTLAGSRHFGDDNAGTIFHTRHADYVNEDGDTVRYVGEIQSDPQQRLIESDVTASYGQSLLEEEMTQLRTDIKLIQFDGVKKQKGCVQISNERV